MKFLERAHEARCRPFRRDIRIFVILLRIDAARYVCYRKRYEEDAAEVTHFARKNEPILRLPRRILAACVVVMHLLAGALHGFCDLDADYASDAPIVRSIKSGLGQTDKGNVAEHHCHGCFSVSVPAPATALIDVERTEKIAALHATKLRGLPPGVDPPPPKFLV